MDIYSAKKQIFNYLTKVQKSDLCHYLASFTKKHREKELSEIVNKFMEDERYYLEISSSRFSWLEEYIEEEQFQKDVELWVKENIKKLKYAEKQRPIYEKQKEYAKRQRKKVQELKMAKQPPTKAQLSYYKALCKRYEIKSRIDTKNSSRLELKNEISKILAEQAASEKKDVLDKLNNTLDLKSE